MKRYIRITSALFTLLAGLMALPAQASQIFLAGDSNIFTTDQDNEVLFQNIFNGKSVANYSNNSLSLVGVTASELHYGSSAVISGAGLSGKDFMIFGYSRSSVSAAELTAISDFYNAGGSLFLYGEGNTGFQALNIAVNAVLDAVGSTMRLSTTENLDNGGFTTLTNFSGVGPYAAGVNSWTTGYTAKILLGSGQAVISGQADAGFTGVAIGLEGGINTPEPASLAILGLGLLGLGFNRRRRLI